jgi:hypothetical protein
MGISRNIPLGLLTFLNPFTKGFSRKEALVYCSRRQGPTGLWEKLPELHYCLFNKGKEQQLGGAFLSLFVN